MKKHTEKQPIDDLFARKLGDMSMTPGPKSWDEIQNRMGNGRTVRVVPVWYRYAAAAACVLFVSGIGWKFYQTNDSSKPEEAVIAKADKKPEAKMKPMAETNTIGNVQITEKAETGNSLADLTVADSERSVKKADSGNKLTQERENKLPEINPQMLPVREENKMVASVPTPTEKLPSAIVETPKTAPVESMKADVAEEASERKLVVMISTPVQITQKNGEAAGEADGRQESGDDEGLSKANKLFKKLKRIKNGEALAYKEESGDEEDAGLISRLYGNVRHSLETKKISKR